MYVCMYVCILDTMLQANDSISNKCENVKKKSIDKSVIPVKHLLQLLLYFMYNTSFFFLQKW